ncbi:hypothetical protein B0H11DRAFT_2199763 [Mycena galericulata]|nr:hypothetical protein B0H11DRAFT_2199763 [Mycena galericulata]
MAGNVAWFIFAVLMLGCVLCCKEGRLPVGRRLLSLNTEVGLIFDFEIAAKARAETVTPETGMIVTNSKNLAIWRLDRRMGNKIDAGRVASKDDVGDASRRVVGYGSGTGWSRPLNLDAGCWCDDGALLDQWTAQMLRGQRRRRRRDDSLDQHGHCPPWGEVGKNSASSQPRVVAKPKVIHGHPFMMRGDTRGWYVRDTENGNHHGTISPDAIRESSAIKDHERAFGELAIWGNERTEAFFWVGFGRARRRDFVRGRQEWMAVTSPPKYTKSALASEHGQRYGIWTKFGIGTVRRHRRSHCRPPDDGVDVYDSEGDATTPNINMSYSLPSPFANHDEMAAGRAQRGRAKAIITRRGSTKMDMVHEKIERKYYSGGQARGSSHLPIPDAQEEEDEEPSALRLPPAWQPT